MNTKVLLDEKPINFVNIRLRTSLFYLHIFLVIVFSVVLFLSENKHMEVIFPMLLFPLLFTFFVVRDNIYFIKLDADNVEIRWVHWFKRKEIICPKSEIELNLKNKYQTNAKVLIIKVENFKIYQAETNVWTKKIQKDIYDYLYVQRDNLL